MSPEWFERLRDVPGVAYESPESVVRNALPGYDETPEVRGYDTEEGHREYLQWGDDIETPVGPPDDPYYEVEYTSRLSPALRHSGAVLESDESTTGAVIRTVWEALELPAAPEDYYRVIEDAIGKLLTRQLDEPQVLGTVEALAWLELRLLAALPHVLVHDDYVWRSQAFDTLVRVYEDEGFVLDAWKVAEVGERFRQGAEERALLSRRIDAIRSERVA